MQHQTADLTGTSCPCEGVYICDTASQSCVRMGAAAPIDSGAGGTDTTGGMDTAGGEDSGGTDAGGEDAGMDVPPVTGGNIWLEAEAATLTAPMATADDGNASGGMYISAPVGTSSTAAAPADGRAVFMFDVAEAGDYRIWGRLIATVAEQDSFWVQVDDGAFVKWNELSPKAEWDWETVHDSDMAAAVQTYTLAAGAHTITIAYREGGGQIDKLLVTNDAGLTPMGMGE